VLIIASASWQGLDAAFFVASFEEVLLPFRNLSKIFHDKSSIKDNYTKSYENPKLLLSDPHPDTLFKKIVSGGVCVYNM